MLLKQSKYMVIADEFYFECDGFATLEEAEEAAKKMRKDNRAIDYYIVEVKKVIEADERLPRKGIKFTGNPEELFPYSALNKFDLTPEGNCVLIRGGVVFPINAGDYVVQGNDYSYKLEIMKPEHFDSKYYLKEER